MRRLALALVLLAAGMCAQITPPGLGPPPDLGFFLGHPPFIFDLDCSGALDQNDVTLALAQILGQAPCTSADFDGNGACDIVDLQLLYLAISYGGIPFYPLGPYQPWCLQSKGLT